MGDNSKTRVGFGRGLIRNKSLQDSSRPIPSTSRGLEIKREPDIEPQSSNNSQPASQPKPAFSISAAAMMDFCSLSSPTPKTPYQPPPRISDLTKDVRTFEPEVKKVKNEPRNQNDEREHQVYVKNINDREKRIASEFMFRPNARYNDVKMELDDDTSSNCPTLDGVSTCLDEINSLLDPDFRIEADKFFKTKRNVDYSGSSLPIVAKQKLIVTQVQLNRVVIIKGTTGCGKTTQVPQFIMEDCYARGKHFNIVVTQPRRLATKSIATRVCDERGWNVGELVGYQIGMDKTAGELTRLLYCTTGVLLQKLINEKKMDNYTHIIIDEVHERSAETDLLLMVVRKFLWSQAAPVKVILMSATIDSSKFIEYFSLKTTSGIPIRPYEVKISESVRPILKQYLNCFPAEWIENAGGNIAEPDYLQFDIDDPNIHPVCYKLCAIMIKWFETLDKSSVRRGAVLVFLPGYEDIRYMTKNLDAFAARNNLNWLILPLHSSITIEEQQRVFIQTRLGERKIILSTNIAESSITVPEVVYVIDYCLTKSLVCDKMTNYPTLKLEWASQNNCEQRAGRCGRVQEGRVFRMVTSEFYDRYMRIDGVPELLRTPLENSVLTLKALDLGSPRESFALCIDSPNLSDLKRAIVRLKRVGALTTTIDDKYNEEDGDLTYLGKMMSALPLDVQLSKLVMMGYLFDCLDDCIIIAACLSLQNFFEKGFDDTIRAYKARLAWTEKTFSDPIAYWYAYRTFFDMVGAGIFELHSKKAKAWCKRNFVQYNRLKDVVTLVDELKKRLSSQGIYTEERPNMVRDKFEDQLILKVILAGAFFPYFYLQSSIVTPDIRKELADKNPLDTVKLSNLPQNEGVLYTNQIKKALSEIDEHMELEFESTHCYITFHAAENDVLAQAVAAQTDGMNVPRIEGALYQESTLNKKVFRENFVKTAVYLAIKLKRHGPPITITKYKPQIAAQRLKALSDIRDGKIQTSGNFRTNRFRISSFTSCRIPEARLPPKYAKKINIYITEVHTNGHFWAQMRDQQTKTMLEELQKAYAEAFKPSSYPYNNPKVGDMILTRYDNRMIDRSEVCRARVVRVDRDKRRLEVYFIDFGGYGTVEFESLNNCVRLDPVKMPAVLFTIPALAMECRLCEVKPAPGRTMIQENRYSDVNTFRYLVSNRDDISGMIYSVTNQVVSLKLFRGIDNGVSLNDKLVLDGLFVKAEEKAASRFDCEVRMNVHEPDGYVDLLYSLDECCTVEPFYDNEEEKYMDDRYINSFSSPFTKEKIRLKGPYTPIEVGFQGVTRQDSMLRVSVDTDSVNSVCCDANPENKSPRLLVASIAQLQQTNNRLTIRNTTLMPDIVGFPYIMAILFSPRVEFRVDLDSLQYTGALFGLGYDEQTKRSYDPDNDMELEFDCYIDNEDIADINLLRFLISQVISHQKLFDEISGQSLFKRQQDIRQQILKILSRHRVTIPFKQKVYRQFEWSAQDQPQINESPDELGRNPFYFSHTAIAQITLHNFKEKLADNLQSMKHVVNGNVRATISCQLCEIKFFNRNTLCDHLASTEHVTLVKKIFEPSRWLEFQIREEFEA